MIRLRTIKTMRIAGVGRGHPEKLAKVEIVGPRFATSRNNEEQNVNCNFDQ